MTQYEFFLGTPWSWRLIFLAVGAGAGWLTLRGYKRRAGEIPAWKLTTLKALRMAGWALLFLCLLEPLLRQKMHETKSSRLTVLIDDSESMGFKDKRDEPGRMERVKAVLLGAPTPARGGAAEDSLLGVLGRSFKVQLEAFGSGARAIQHPGELTAQSPATDVAKGLTEAFGRLKGPDAAGLVLISDGADTGKGDLNRVIAAYRTAGTPIYVLAAGDTDIQDLAIAQVRCRRKVSKDTLVKVEVDVRAVGIPDGDQTVRITRDGKVVGSDKVLKLRGGEATATFEFLPEGQDFQQYTAEIERFPGEAVLENNSMTFGLVAYSRKLKILYMEGSMYLHNTYESKTLPRYHDMQRWWEHQFLEQALLEDSDVEVEILAKEPFKVPFGVTEPRMKSVKEGGYPKTKKELYQYDVIVCSDIPFGAFTDEQIQWTVDFVGKHGGGFIMIGGYDSFAEGKYAKTAIDRMLPVEMLDEKHLERDFNWRLTDEALGTAEGKEIMMVDKDLEKTRQAWAGLPGFHGLSRTTKKKPAATVLAEVEDESFDTAYGPAILLAVQPFGNGRSMAFTSDCTGSWGAEWEDSWGPKREESSANEAERNLYYKQFWKNTIRWLAHYRMQAPNQLVTIESDRLLYSRGEEPLIRVKVMNEDYELTHDAKVTLSVVKKDGVGPASVPELTLFPKYEEPGIYERKLELAEVGQYDVKAIAVLPKTGDEIGRDQTILHIQPATVEMRQPSQNAELLKRLAKETGGLYLPLADAAQLPKHLREATHVIEKHRDNDLWDRWWIFAAIIGLLCGEWFLRKRSGLP